jgi:hypothetical protein
MFNNLTVKDLVFEVSAVHLEFVGLLRILHKFLLSKD